MKNRVNLFLLFLLMAITVSGQKNEEEIPLAPKEYRRTPGYDPKPFRYQYSLKELNEQYSDRLMEEAKNEYNRLLEVNAQGKWKPTRTSIDEHRAPEWFEDMKFGMFIDWGLWSIAGWAVKNDHAMYPDWYELRLHHSEPFIKYHEKNWGKDFKRDDFIPLFKAEKYDPKKLVDIAEDAGMKYIIPFSKHHSGFCLWPSSYTHRDVDDMVAKGTDYIKPLVDNCKEKGLKFGFYFSVEEWEYPVIAPDGTLVNRKWSGKFEPYKEELETRASGKIAVKDFSRDYIVPQAIEFIDKYDPDILWYDGEWETPVEFLGSYDISAYFYNQAEGRKTVAVNDRYGTANGKRLRSHRGDFLTSEYGNMADHFREKRAWEECRGISQSFGFNWQDTDDNVISSKKFIDMFVNIVSQGGNLLLIVNLDGQGALPEMQEKRLKDIGNWLKVNGEGIYNTRSYSITSENNVRYTRSKDNKTVYAITLEWPEEELRLTSVKPAANSDIYMLGYDKPLKWSFKDGITSIILPKSLQKGSKRPCEFAYTFRIRQE